MSLWAWMCRDWFGGCRQSTAHTAQPVQFALVRFAPVGVWFRSGKYIICLVTNRDLNAPLPPRQCNRHPTFERIPNWIAGSEVLVSGDWSKVWNYDTLPLPASNVGASAGVGVRPRVMNKVTLTMAAAKPLIVPRLADQGNGWRFVFAISGGF